MIIYLAGPMDYAGEFDTEGDRQLARDELGCAIYDPTSAYKGAMEDPAAVMAMNDAAIAQCDGLLAIWPPLIMSVGTPYEIFLAKRLGKPVVVVGPTRSLQLIGARIPVYSLDDIPAACERLAREVEARDVAASVEEFARPGVLPASGPPDASEERSLDFVGERSPRRSTVGDAGLDMFVSEDTVIPAHGFADVPLGVSVALPAGMWGMLVGRSSTIRQRGLQVQQGIIDNGYRGPMFAGCWNMNAWDVLVQEGDRIAQLIVLPLVDCYPRRVDALDETERGTGGFGSTGT